MQPDLPEPVVPAIRMCGMRARSAQTAAPEMSLPSQTRERARRLRQVVVDVAERDDARAEVRDLDADRLLAGDRREDADLGRGERVAEVVLQVRDLADLRPGRELQLVAGDTRAGDLADHRRLDAEVRQAGDERVGDALAGVRVRAAAALRLLQERCGPAARTRRAGADGRSKSASCDSCVSVLERVGLGHEQRRRRPRDRVGDEVWIVVLDVDRWQRRRQTGVARTESGSCAGRVARSVVCARLHGVARPAEDRAEAGAGQEERAGDGQQDAEDRRAGRAEPERRRATRGRRRRRRRDRCRASAAGR